MILTSPTLHGCGHITGAWESADGTVLAIANAFPLLTNPPARAAYAGQKLRHRVSLHRRGERMPFAWFDKLRLPINWIGLHPRETKIAIAAGTYDGGWMFEGQLLIWDWTEDSWSEPFPQMPEVVWVNFRPDGTELDLIVRPWDEQWGGDPDRPEDDAFTRFYAVTADADRCTPEAQLELDPLAKLTANGQKALPAFETLRRDASEKVAAWLNVPDLATRGAIWDVAWFGPDKIASVSDDCLLQVNSLTGDELVRIEGDGYGAVIVSSEPPLVHAARHRDRDEGEVASRLLSVHDGSLVELGSYPGSYSFTGSSNGTVLGRLDRNRRGSATSDLIIDVATGAVVSIDLGHYDCFNHFIGLKGAPAQYFLQASPPHGHERKHLCRLDADLKVERLWPVLHQNGRHASHAMECCACYFEDANGAGIVIAGTHYDPSPSTPTRGFVYRKDPSADLELWRQPTTSASSAIVHLPGLNLIAAAFLDGTLKLIDATTGTTKAAGNVTIDAMPTVIFSLAAKGPVLAIGTFDGRVATLDPASLLATGSTIGRIELA